MQTMHTMPPFLSRSCATLLIAMLCACSSSNSSDDDLRPPPPPGANAELGVFVIVVDSLMPQEIGAPLTPTPTLVGLRNAGTSYSESRSVFVAETIPNHVAMMTGVYPDKSGIPANEYWNRSGAPERADLSLPSELEVPTLFTRIKQECPNIRTAAAMSKDYLYEVFSDCGFSGTDCGTNHAPDQHFDPTRSPAFLPSPAGLTPDSVTMQAALDMLPNTDFMFINLGQVDRMGHVDETGVTGTPLLRNLVIQDTDLQIQRFIQALQSSGRWEKSVVFIVSDHGMDWGLPNNYINESSTLETFGLFSGSGRGSTAGYFLTNPLDPLRESKLKMARDLLLALPGVENVWYRELNSLDVGINTLLPDHFHARHENIGDLIAEAKAGYRFSEPSAQTNPIPGNHGNKLTLHNTFIIGGGAPFVRAQVISEPDEPVDHYERRPAQSENTDVASTVAWLFGMTTAGFDGRVLSEAFSSSAPPSRCGVMR
jgi:hypothetical protein